MADKTFDIGPTPKFVKGGCLCGTIRYRVDFPENHDFAANSMICLCTQCKKQTSSLFYVAHRVSPPSSLSWLAPGTDESKGGDYDATPASLKLFRASAQAERGFCADCGSLIFWRRVGDDGKKYVSFAVGTVDALYLVGEGADGKDVPFGGFGMALASGRGCVEWTAGDIPGVTDDMPLLHRGKRFVQEE